MTFKNSKPVLHELKHVLADEVLNMVKGTGMYNYISALCYIWGYYKAMNAITAGKSFLVC